MHTLGAVLSLTSNFRSVSSIEAVVNDHFIGVFPEIATAEQAPYSRMETVRDPEGADGVYRYIVRPDGRAKDDIVGLDATMLASWITDRIASGERKAGDFLILTSTKAPIADYARALAERNVPVTTTGARLPQEHELHELLVVLRAIADPENAVIVAAALEGLFFGLSPADLFAASRIGIRFALTHPPANEEHVVGRALRRLHEWWRLSQRHPADVLLERILDDTGLLFHAAGMTLGEARAGALLHIVEALRAASVLGANGIVDALDRLEVLLAAEAADAPLRPGRTDAVRVMNLHKAKGLEAKVVVLAAPTDLSERDPIVHVTRDEAGTAAGGLCIGYRNGKNHVALAHPPGWAEMQEEERRFGEAERARLLYVAATRAKRELVVAQAEKQLREGPKPDASMWRPLAPVLGEHSVYIELPQHAPAGRRKVERSATSLSEATQAAAQRVQRAKAPSIIVRTVTEAAKSDPAPLLGAGGPRGAGPAWGRAVHRSIEALGRGRRGTAMRAFALAVARDEELSAEQGEALVRVIERIEASDAWRRLTASGTLQMELSIMRHVVDAEHAILTEGVIDAARLGDDGCEIVDWKTDVVDDVTWARRKVQYERQVGAYAGMLSELTGLPARGRIERVRE
jgi:ATP-dependent helicase/nuclease subunit A